MGNRDYWIKGILLAVILYLVVSLGQNVWELRRSQRRLTDAELRLKSLAEEEYRLSRRLQLVETDGFVEAEIRNKLHLARSGEVVLVFRWFNSRKVKVRYDNGEYAKDWIFFWRVIENEASK